MSGRQESGSLAKGGAGQVRDTGIAPITLAARAERTLIRPHHSRRHVDFAVTVGAMERTPAERLPLRLVLVLDRSGSMGTMKLAMARKAALAVVEQLDERDTVALVTFDDRIEVAQALAPATSAVKDAIAQALRAVTARGSTALYEGWLTGCKQVAAEATSATDAVTRCFLLTDGQANVGVTDAEEIARKAADVLENAGVGTSTFGIGDYDEHLLGPMAMAGGGQFHHLREPEEIATTFVNELGEMLTVAARQAYLVIEADEGIYLKAVSAYHLTQPHGTGRHWRVPLGDLVAGEERHLTMAVHFPDGEQPTRRVIRGRLVWLTNEGERQTDWQDLVFTYASHAACDAERSDPVVMHWVGLHYAARAQMEAMRLASHGEVDEARARIASTAGRIERYAGDDSDLLKAVDELIAAKDDLYSKERYYRSHSMSRSHGDLRSPRANP